MATAAARRRMTQCGQVRTVDIDAGIGDNRSPCINQTGARFAINESAPLRRCSIRESICDVGLRGPSRKGIVI